MHGPGREPGLSEASAQNPPHRTSGAMFVALYGSFTRHPWQAGARDAPDPDYLIRDRTQAMEWSLEAGQGVGPGTAGIHGVPDLWRVRDAGPDEVVPASADEPFAWFHCDAQTLPEAPLPIRALLRGCADAMSRLGSVDLTTAQVLLPVDRLVPSLRMDRFPAVDGIGWWLGCDPAARTDVRISLNSGQDMSIARSGEDIMALFAGLDQSVVHLDLSTFTDQPPRGPRPILADHLWAGPPGIEVGIDASFAEWNLDTVGWFTSVLADVAAHCGVRAPLLTTITPSQPGHGGTPQA